MNQPFGTFLKALAEEDVSPLTVQAYGSDLAALAQWWATARPGEPLTPANVTAADLRDWRTALSAEHKPAGVNRRLAAARRWLRYHQAIGEIAGVPQVKSIRRTPLAPKTPPRADILATGRAAEKAGPLAVAVTSLLRHTGCRVSEAAAARLGDMVIGERRGEWLVRGKGHRERTIPLNATVRADLRRYLAKRPKTAHDNIFVGVGGRPLSARAMRDLVRRLSDGKLHPHLYRHAALSALARQGDLPAAMKLAGHSRLDTLLVYTQPSQADIERAMRVLDDED